MAISRNRSFEKWWPNLARTGYTITSDRDPHYNCFAWAAHQTDRWWDSDPDAAAMREDIYWPLGIPQENTLEAFIQAYATLGFNSSADDSVETGYEKIAIYATNSVPDHATRQLPNGRWTSKICEYEDIEHSLDAFVGGKYFGPVAVILKRPIS
jgi:hypothetical protein